MSCKLGLAFLEKSRYNIVEANKYPNWARSARFDGNVEWMAEFHQFVSE